MYQNYGFFPADLAVAVADDAAGKECFSFSYEGDTI